MGTWARSRPLALGKQARPPPQWESSRMAITKEAFVSAIIESIATSERHETPYRHWFLARCLPDDALEAILSLPFPAPALDGVSGVPVTDRKPDSPWIRRS